MTRSTHKITWKNTAKNFEVVFYKMAAKTVEDTANSGTITKISEDERFGMLQTESRLEKLQNLMLDIGQNLYAKITNVEGNNYTICFTSKPEIFAEMLEKMKI